MSLADIVAVVLFIAISAYAVLAGADFGAGFWDLTAGGAKKGRPMRALIEQSIGPVWETNHIWIIFALVLLWTCFAVVFGSIMSTLYVPLLLAAFGIILRGAAFAFRKEVVRVDEQRFFGAVFALSSIITPFFFGAIAGGIASGRVPVGNAAGNELTSWWNPTSVLGGVLAVVVCAFLAAVYLCDDARHSGDEQLTDSLRLRAIGAALVAGAVAIGGIFILREDAKVLYDDLTGRALVLIIVSVIAGLVTLAFLWDRRYAEARVSAALAVVMVVWAWGVALWPNMLEPRGGTGGITVEDAAGSNATLAVVVGVVAVGLVILVPALIYLFVLVNKGELVEETPLESPPPAADAATG